MNAYEKLQQQNTNLSTALRMVQESLQYMNEEIQLLSSVLPHATTKFSVKGTFDSYSIVHINFHQHKCYAKCTEGMCAVSMHNRARIPKKVPVSHTEQLCVHMNTLYRKIDYIKASSLSILMQKKMILMKKTQHLVLFKQKKLIWKTQTSEQNFVGILTQKQDYGITNVYLKINQQT